MKFFMTPAKEIIVQGIEIAVSSAKQNDKDYISLTDMAKFKTYRSGIVISNWLTTKYTAQFMGAWEQLHNPNFNVMEFHNIKNEIGTNGFIISSSMWIKNTNAIGIKSVAGRYGGGTFAHKDIAFEFASWLSPEFKLYLIKEFQRLKEEENKKTALGWDLKRSLAKINYRIHTGAIKEHLIPKEITGRQAHAIYASEGDILNMALFGMTAKDWRIQNPDKEGNIRDYATVEQLVVLSNLESLNAIWLEEKIAQPERLIKLNKTAISQMRALIGSPGMKRLEK
jgi:hypothetical protein